MPTRSDLPALMTRTEKDSLGLGKAIGDLDGAELADPELTRVLGRRVDRIGHDELPGLVRDARRLAERHFLARALERAGGKEALKRSLGVRQRRSARKKRS